MARRNVFALVLFIALTAAAGAQAAQTSALASARSVGRGRAIAQAYCATCHAVGEAGKSPNTLAPPFRQLQRHYPLADVIAALAEGAQPMHPAMPRFHLDLAQSRDLIAYLQSIQE